MGNLGRMLVKNMRKPEGEERESLIAEYKGFHNIERKEDGSLVTWEPKDKASHTPVPERFHSNGDCFWGSVTERYRGRKFFILGAGSSALTLHGLESLNGQLVYGINWTWKWFNPTFLQAMDAAPIQKGVVEIKDALRKERERDTCLVANTKHLEKLDGKWNGNILPFGTMEEWKLQEDVGAPVLHTSNSLGVALTIASWFQPERIILLGFDFGGAHIFGDGRSEGCIGHYGEEGSAHKQDLQPKLRFLRDRLYDRRIPIAQVGDTALDIFPGAMNLEHAINGDRREFLWP